MAACGPTPPPPPSSSQDAASYIHRVGRTARFQARGHGLLVLTPAEAPGMLPLLAAARVPLTQMRIAASAAVSVTGKLAAEVRGGHPKGGGGAGG